MKDDLLDVIQDEARLEAVRRTSLLDSPPEEAFDRLTRTATIVLRAPIAIVSLADSDRLFFKSQCGLGEPLATWRQNPLTHSFCRYVVGHGEPLFVSDARRDPVFAEYPAVLELGVTAYAGIPLLTAEGHALGTFSVVDTRPREWTEEEMGILRVLATCTMSEIELRLRVAELRALTTNLEGVVESRTRALKASEERQGVLLDVNNAIVNCLDRDSLLSTIGTALTDAIPFTRASLVLHDQIKDTFRTLVVTGSVAPDTAIPVGTQWPR